MRTAAGNSWVPIGVCPRCWQSEYGQHRHGCPVRLRRRTMVRVVVTVALGVLSGIAVGMLAVLPGMWGF